MLSLSLRPKLKKNTHLELALAVGWSGAMSVVELFSPPTI